ncbi:MAG: hypothetical protein ACJAWO_000936 [Halieaceae bacterium]|jgi:hypothetical protein
MDFNKINCTVWTNTQLPFSDTLTLNITGSEVRYLTLAKPSFNLFPMAYALSCESEGYRGLKNAVSLIEITSNQDFDSTHLAGTSLNDLFLMELYNSEKTFVPITASNMKLIFNLAQYSLEQRLIITTKPDSLTAHLFTIKMYISNGRFLNATSPEVTWN